MKFIKKLSVLAISLALSVVIANAEIVQKSVTITPSTSTNSVSAGLVAPAPFSATLNRLVVTIPAGVTNIDFSLVDADGTSLVSSNSIGGSTNSATKVTFNLTNIGVNPTIFTKNTKAITTNAYHVGVILTGVK